MLLFVTVAVQSPLSVGAVFPNLENLWAHGLFPHPCRRRQRARKPTVDSRVRLCSHRLKKTCTQKRRGF